MHRKLVSDFVFIYIRRRETNFFNCKVGWVALAPAELRYWKNFGKRLRDTILYLLVERLLTRFNCFSDGIEFGQDRVF